MEEGAWQSEVFDNGRDFKKERASPSPPPPSAGTTPPAMYNPAPVPMGKDSRVFGIVAVALRSTLFLFTLIALSVMGSNKATIYSAYYGLYTTSVSSYTAKFTAVKAFVGLLSVDVIICLYAVVQLVLCFLQLSRSGAFVSSPTSGGSIITFAVDSVLAYLLIAAGSAAADSQYVIGQDGCAGLGSFCRKAEASIAFSFLAFAVLAASVALFPVRLLRLTK